MGDYAKGFNEKTENIKKTVQKMKSFFLCFYMFYVMMIKDDLQKKTFHFLDA